MKNTVVSRHLLGSVVVLMIFLFSACQDSGPSTGAGTAETAPLASTAPAADQGAPVPEGQALELLRFGPSGQVNKISQVVAMFNQPMVALGDYDNPPPQAVTFDPPLDGQLKWLNQYTLAFVPTKPLTGSLDLQATLNPADLKALSGARLAAGAQIEINLPDFGVRHCYQLNARPRDEEEALRPRWRVTFNQDPDLESLKSKAFYVWAESGDRKKIPAVPADRPDGQGGRDFNFSPAEKLPPNTLYWLIVEEGVKSLEGPKPGPQVVVAEGRTYGPLTVGLDNDRGRTMDPENGFYLNFSNMVRLSQIVPLIKLDNGYDLEPLRRRYAPPAAGEEGSNPDKTTADDDEEEDLSDFQDYLYLPGGFKANTTYTLTVDGSAQDIFGQKLGRDLVQKFTTGSYETSLALTDGFGLMETATRPWLRLRASNIKEARLEGYSLDADRAIAFLSAAAFSPDYYGDITEAEKTLQDLTPLILSVPEGAVNGRTALKVDLEKLFGDEMKGRLLYLRSAWAGPREKGNSPRNHTFALTLISDIGLAIKMGPESSLIWTTDLARGRAWPGVELELRDAENKTLWSGRSDARGLAQLPGTAEIMPRAAGESLFVVARSGEQMSLWNASWNDGLENWRWNVNFGEALNPRSNQSHWLLNALPLYKPGERAKFKLIARRQDGDKLNDVADEELHLEILDGRGEVVESATVRTNSFGTVSHEIALAEEAALGYWTVKAGPVGREEIDHIGTFMVMNYRPPALEIKFEDLPESAVAGDELNIALKADYHFGAPVAGQPVSYQVSATPAWFRLPGNFSRYNVVNDFVVTDENSDQGDRYSEPTVSVASDELNLDSDGRLNFKLNLTPAPDQRPLPRTYNTFVNVKDVDGRSVSTGASLLVHPAELYAGLTSDNFLTQAGTAMNLKLIVVDTDGAPVPDRRVTVTLYRRDWRNVRRKSAGTAYEYVSKIVDSKIESRELVSGDMPLELSLTPPEAGYYWVLAEVRDDREKLNQASCSFYASGSGPVGWAMANDDRVTLVADQPEYRPGQTARIMVQSPFDRGQGLMTVERAGVRRSEVFDIVDQTPVLEVPLTADDSPNVYVSVLLSRGRIADTLDERGLDFGKPAIRLGYTELKIPTRENLFQVEVTPDQTEVGPGGEVEVTVKVTDQEGKPVSQAEVALIAADAAVLQLGGEVAYHPEISYHRDQPLRVQTADNLISLIGRQNWGSKGDNPGGGGGEMMSAMAGGGSDGVRRLFAALAWFEPHLALDDQGLAKVKIKMPENLSTFKIFAVATGHGRRTGTGSGSVLVSRDLLLRSALPGYAGVGDEFEAAMVVSNRGRNSGQAAVKLSGRNFTILDGQAEKKADIGPGESREVRFRVKAGPEDRATFLFEVALGEETDKVEFSLPVSPANKLSTQASYERLTEGRLKTDLALTEGLDLDRGGLVLQLAPSLIGVMDEPFRWMAAYPHGCVEQTTSQAYVGLVRLDLRDRLKITDKEAEAARNNVAGQLDRLRQWEQGGGFNYWPGGYDWSNRSVYLSAYILDFLLSAQAAGFDLPDPGLIERVSGFLKSALSAESKAFPDWFSERAVREAKSYALAMLSRGGENVAAYIEVEYQKRSTLTLFELVNLIRAVGFSPQGPVREERLRSLWPLLDKHLLVTAGEVQLVESEAGAPEIWSSSARTTAMTLTALCETAPDHDLIPGLLRWLVSASRGGHFGSTQNNAVALKALSQYVKVMEPGWPDLTIEAKLGETTLAEAHFESYLDPATGGAVSLRLIPTAEPAVTYYNSGQGQAWAALKMRSAPLEPDLAPAGSGGFMLSRSFAVLAPKEGRPGADRFQRGDLVRVSVTMMVPAPRHNVVLEDRVPAGFEPINFRLADADQTLQSLVNSQDDPRPNLYWYNHQEIWPDRVAVYADHLDAGVYTYSYLARAITSGTYLTPGPRAEEMYAPETFGRGSGQILTVE